MTSHEYTARSKYLAAENRKHSRFLHEIPKEEWPWKQSPSLVRVLRPEGFLMQVFDIGNDALRLTVCRSAIERDGEWKSDITWEQLQELKRQAGYGDRCAIEIYPPDADIVNVANMRHLWVTRDHEMPEVMWRKRRIA